MKFADLTYEQVWDCAIRMEKNRHLGMNSAEIFAVMMYAHGLGLDPFNALYGGIRSPRGSGKMELSPQMMNCAMNCRGHRVEQVMLSDNVCVLRGTRGDNGVVMEAQFSYEDAKKAGLLSNGTWEKYRHDMLFARAISRLCRRLAPDAIGTAYVIGEIPDEDDDNQEPKIVKQEHQIKQEENKPTRVEYSEEDLQEFGSKLMSDHLHVDQVGAFLISCQSKIKDDVKNWLTLTYEAKKAEIEDCLTRWVGQQKTSEGEKK